MEAPSFVSGAPPCKRAYVMQRPVQNARGDGRKGFWKGLSCAYSASVCVHVPMGGELRTEEGYSVLWTSCLILGKSLSLLWCCLPSP